MAQLAHLAAELASCGMSEDEPRFRDKMGAMCRPQAAQTLTPVYKQLSFPNMSHSPTPSHSAEINGRRIHQCFTCIMAVPGRIEKVRLLKEFFIRREMQSAKTEGDFYKWRFVTVATVSSVLHHFQQYSYGLLNNEFRNVADFGAFLIEASFCSFLSGLIRVPADSFDPVAWLSWRPVTSRDDGDETTHGEQNCCPYHAINCIAAMCALEKDLICNAVTAEQQEAVRRTANNIAKSGLVFRLLDYVDGHRGLLEAVRACCALREIAFTSSQGAFEIMDSGGLPILGKLFTPDVFSDMLSKAHETTLPTADKTKTVLFPSYYLTLLAPEVENLLPEVDPDTMTGKEIYRRLAILSTTVVETVGATIAYTLETCIGARSVMLTEPLVVVVTAAIGWLQRPGVTLTDQVNAVRAICVLKQVLDSNVGTVQKLIDRYDILGVLENWLYPISNFHINDALQCCLAIARLGGSARAALAERASLLEPVAALIYSSSPLVQESALRVVATVAQHHRAAVQHLMSECLISPDMLKRAPRLTAPCITLLEKLQQSCAKACTLLWRVQDASIVMQCVGDAATSGQLQSCGREELKEIGRQHFADNDYKLAIRYYSAALLLAKDRPAVMDETDTILLGNRAECYLRLEQNADALRDSAIAISSHLKHCTGGGHLVPIVMKCAFRRAKAFFKLGRYFLAVRDASFCVSKDADQEKFVELQRNAQFAFDQRSGSEERQKLDGEKPKQSARPRHRTCTGCGLVGPGMKKCSRCERGVFCSKACLKANWPKHQKTCQM